MKKTKRLIFVLLCIVIAMLIAVRPSYADETDIYEGSYTIEDIISKYNVVTFEDIKTLIHIVGPVLVNNDLGIEGEVIYHTQQTNGINSFIKGHINAGGNAMPTDGNRLSSKLYVGTSNTVVAETENGAVVLEEGAHVEASQYKVNDFDAYTHYMTVITDNYFDFERLKNNIIAQQTSFEEGTVVEKDNDGVIYIRAGEVSTINSLEGVTKIVLNGFDVAMEETTLINIKAEGEVYIPMIFGDNDNQLDAGDGYIGDDNSMNLIWSIPNATSIILNDAPFVGHIIAPNADINIGTGYVAGCLIVNNITSVSGAETHYYPYKKVEEKTVSATINKIDADTQLAINGASIQVFDSNNKLVDTWISDGKSHVINGLKPDTTYTLKEVITPQGYQVAEETIFTINEDGTINTDSNKTTTKYTDDGILIIENTMNKADVSITKHSETLDGETLEGTSYILYKVVSSQSGDITKYYTGVNNKGIATWNDNRNNAMVKVTESDGVAVFSGITMTVEDITNTNYFFEEVNAPENHLLDSTPIPVTINYENFESGKIIASVHQANKKIPEKPDEPKQEPSKKPPIKEPAKDPVKDPEENPKDPTEKPKEEVKKEEPVEEKKEDPIQEITQSVKTSDPIYISVIELFMSMVVCTILLAIRVAKKCSNNNE